MSEALDDALARLFAVVRKEAKANPGFAAKLSQALAIPPPGDDPQPAEAARFDPVAVYAEQGEAGLRAVLADMTKPDLYALVRASDLEPRGASSFNRARLIEHVVSVVRRRNTPKRSAFDY